MKTVHYFSLIALLSVATICNSASTESATETTQSTKPAFVAGTVTGSAIGIALTLGSQEVASTCSFLKTKASESYAQATEKAETATNWISKKAGSVSAEAVSFWNSLTTNIASGWTQAGEFASSAKDATLLGLTIAKDTLVSSCNNAKGALVSSCNKAKDVIMENPKMSAAIAAGTVATLAAYKYRKALGEKAIALKNKTAELLAKPMTYGAALGSAALTGLGYIVYTNQGMLLELGKSCTTKSLSLVTTSQQADVLLAN